jgi:hypothetical protein
MEEKKRLESVKIGDNIVIKEMQLYNTIEKNCYVILLTTNGQLFIYDDAQKRVTPIKPSIDVFSLSFASLFKKPIWKHIAAPIRYKNKFCLPISTDHDVFLAEINHTEKNKKTSFDLNVTEKIISHNTTIHTVQSFNEDCVMSSSTYPTTKFWHNNPKKKTENLPGYLLLGGDTNELYFIKDKHKTSKWDRWNNRNAKNRSGTLCIKKYDTLENQKNIPKIDLNMDEPASDIIFATMEKESIIKANEKYYSYHNTATLSDFHMPKEFSKYLNDLKQLYIINLLKKDPATDDPKTFPPKYVIGTTPGHIYLWQLDLLEKERSYDYDRLPKQTHLYDFNFTSKITEDAPYTTIQKTILNTSNKTLYIVCQKEKTLDKTFEKITSCAIYTYIIPNDYAELRTRTINGEFSDFIQFDTEKYEKTLLKKLRTSTNRTSTKMQEKSYKTKTSARNYELSLKLTQNLITAVLMSRNTFIRIPLIFFDGNEIDSKNTEETYEKLQYKHFSYYQETNSKSNSKQKIYFQSNNDIIIVHVFGQEDSRNYAEYHSVEPNENNLSYATLTFSLKDIPDVGEKYISIATGATENKKEIEAKLNMFNNASITDPESFIENLKNQMFNFEEMITKKELLHSKYIITATLIFKNENSEDQIHIDYNTHEKSRARYYSKKHLDDEKNS